MIDLNGSDFTELTKDLAFGAGLPAGYGAVSSQHGRGRSGPMTLDDIPAGSRILLDANVLIYARRGVSAQCRRLLERCAIGEVTGVVTTFVLAETK